VDTPPAALKHPDQINPPSRVETGIDSRGFPALKAILLTVVATVLLLAIHHWWNQARTWEKTDNATIVGTAHQISSRTSGSISEVLVLDHQSVKAGQILIRMDDGDEQAALSRARATLLQADAQIALAQANSNKAKADFERASELIKSRVFSIADIDTARAAKDAAAAALALAEAGKDVSLAALHEAELQLSYTVIKAPSDGHIGAKAVQTGNRVFPGQPLMAVVEDFSWIVANFKETQVSKMQHGQRVEVRIDAFPGRIFPASVESVSPASGATFALLPPDNATGNFTKVVQRVPVKIYFDEPDAREFNGRLLPGFSVIVSVNVREPSHVPGALSATRSHE
jgi:membrane fusion protein (multidrug efflux system)